MWTQESVPPTAEINTSKKLNDQASDGKGKMASSVEGNRPQCLKTVSPRVSC